MLKLELFDLWPDELDAISSEFSLETFENCVENIDVFEDSVDDDADFSRFCPITPPSSPESRRKSLWTCLDSADIGGDVASEIGSDVCQSDGDAPMDVGSDLDEIADDIAGEIWADYNRGQFHNKDITEDYCGYEDYVRRIELAILAEMRDGNCLLSGMCADRAGSECRHRKRFDGQRESPSCGEMLVDELSRQPPKTKKVCQIFYHPYTDHNYHGEQRPMSPVRTDEYLGIETPSDSDDSEIDVVNIKKTNFILRYHIAEKKIPAPSVDKTRRRISPAKSRTAPPREAKSGAVKDEPLKLTIRKVNSANKNWNKNGHYTVKGSRSAFAPGLSEEERNKRLDHNKMERQRRKMSLNYCYMLRDVIPCFNQRQKPKMSKVMVLTEGTKYIKELQETEAELAETKEALERRNKELKEKLKSLKEGKSRIARRSQSLRKSSRKQRK